MAHNERAKGNFCSIFSWFFIINFIRFINLLFTYLCLCVRVSERVSEQVSEWVVFVSDILLRDIAFSSSISSLFSQSQQLGMLSTRSQRWRWDRTGPDQTGSVQFGGVILFQNFNFVSCICPDSCSWSYICPSSRMEWRMEWNALFLPNASSESEPS